MIRLGIGLKRSASYLWDRSESAWEMQRRIFWEDINVAWENWNTVLGTYKLWEEQSKEFWELESTVNWEDWQETQGTLEIWEEKTTDNWESISNNWEDYK